VVPAFLHAASLPLDERAPPRQLKRHHNRQPPHAQPPQDTQPAPGVEALANAVQHSERPHHKREGGGEAERLVVGGDQQVLADGGEDGLAARLGLLLGALRLEVLAVAVALLVVLVVFGCDWLCWLCLVVLLVCDVRRKLGWCD